VRVKKEIPRESFTTRLKPDLIVKLKHLAVDRKKPTNAILEEAIEGLLEKEGLLKKQQSKK
jgi:predicted transcriptional regulator